MRFLAEKGVSFEEKDIVAHPAYREELLALTEGAPGTPVIVIDEAVYRGFDRGKITRALNLN